MQVSYSENVLVIFSKGFLNPYFMMSPFYWLPLPFSRFCPQPVVCSQFSVLH